MAPMRQILLSLLISAPLLLACSNDADDLGIGAECTADDQCQDGQRCLMQFKGGYCGLENCTRNADCPSLSACVAHDDGTNYCFRTCADKPECNANRSAANEANCSSSITFVDPDTRAKACVPPSG
jgi:hypothetical protein